jgi:hypothetical protein
MAEETSTTSTGSASRIALASSLNWLSIFQFLKDNFVVVSGLTVAAGLVFSTIFLSAYFYVFDWHLIWFVQSADVITFGLIAAGVVGSSLTLLYSISYNALTLRRPDGKLNWSFISICGVIVLLTIAFQIYGEHVGPNPHYFHLGAGWATIFCAIVLVPVIASHFKAGAWPTIPQSIGMLFGAITATASFGNWVALTVAESSEIAQDVMTKDQTYSGVKVVIVMSRHTVLLKDSDLLVVPTADITQFKGKGSVLIRVPTTVPPAPTARRAD